VIEPFGFGVGLHLHRARHDERAHPVLHPAAANDVGRGTQVLEA
jgi:hypothetical protein